MRAKRTCLQERVHGTCRVAKTTVAVRQTTSIEISPLFAGTSDFSSLLFPLFFSAAICMVTPQRNGTANTRATQGANREDLILTIVNIFGAINIAKIMLASTTRSCIIRVWGVTGILLLSMGPDGSAVLASSQEIPWQECRIQTDDHWSPLSALNPAMLGLEKHERRYTCSIEEGGPSLKPGGLQGVQPSAPGGWSHRFSAQILPSSMSSARQYLRPRGSPVPIARGHDRGGHVHAERAEHTRW